MNGTIKTVGATLIFIVSAIVLIAGCQKTSSKKSQNLFYDSKTNVKYNLDNPTELASLVKIIANEKGELAFIEQPAFTELKDSKGFYKAITANYKVDDEVTRLVIPMSDQFINSAANNSQEVGVMYYQTTGCEMKCTSAWGCGGCTQTIIERCVSQTCTCSTSGGCSSKIVFLN